MGLIKKTVYTGILAGASLVGYLGSTTTITCPLPRDDPIWRSRTFAKYNKHANPSAQDIVTRTIPISKIKPELLQHEGDLVVEFCRGVWSGWGYRFQRSYLSRKYEGPATSDQLWTVDQLAKSRYDTSVKITDHFEVVEKTPTEITVRCGDTPRNGGPRDSDGLFIISAEIDRERGEAVLGLKSCFFTSARKVEGIAGPMPAWMEELHAWYSRLWLATGSWKVMR